MILLARVTNASVFVFPRRARLREQSRSMQQKQFAMNKNLIGLNFSYDPRPLLASLMNTA